METPSTTYYLGYARVSTDEQDLASQMTRLREVGCKKIFSEKITGTLRARPELDKLLEQIRKDDVLVVTRLDRLARNTRDLLEIAEHLRAHGSGLRSLSEPWADTTTPAGRMVLTVFAGIAEFERNLIVERTQAGREQAKAKGVKFGAKPILTPEKVKVARKLIEEGKTVKEIATLFGVHRASIYRALERNE
jgi:DNA invertase Pin-like site-specific DNA recombinase